MKFEDHAEVMRHMDAIGLNLEYVDVLLRDIIEGFLMPLVHGDHTPGTLAKIEAGPTLTKAEMLETFMGQITEHHAAMLPFIFTPDPMPDHSTMSDAEREAEISRDILKAVEKIALRPDWLEKLKLLNFVAWEIATGDTTTKT